MSAACAVALATPGFARQARRPAGSKPTEVPLHVSLKAGTAQYAFDGPGSCRVAPHAAIHDAPASMWSVQHDGEDRSLSLTMWRIKGGGDMMSLAASANGKSHSVNTVKVGIQGQVQGSGTIAFEAAGKGGKFTIAATAADGARITGTVTCEAFTPLIAEGGL